MIRRPEKEFPAWWRDLGDVLVFLAISAVLVIGALKGMEVFAWLTNPW
jgi:hypothetical protein